MSRLAPVLAAALVAAACNVNPYTLGDGDGDGGAGPGDGGQIVDDGGGAIDAGGPSADAGLDGGICLPSPEVCDEVDNDCDTDVDEGFNLDADPENCGMCGNACEYVHAFGRCDTGICEQGDCFPGWNDLDPLDPGCEYFCIQTNNGVEQCDGVDNNCDGDIDEGFNLDDDVDNCGQCGYQCNLLNATPTCELGTCVVDTCTGDFHDIDPQVPGCEYFCIESNNGVEQCDGVDNDCDGVVDDGNPGGGASCGTDEGECTAGTTQCSFGVLFCIGQVQGQLEVCDGLDNDCSDGVDEDWDKMNDPLHCGSCDPCQVPNAVPACNMGTCEVGSCNFGYHDLDPMEPGCEYACIDTGAETCDGVDNNCNGQADEIFDFDNDPNTCGNCTTQCSYPNAGALCVNGGCVQGTCDTDFWDVDPMVPGCEYFCQPTNNGVETCDGLDNDCNGQIDDGNPGGGLACGTNEGECSEGTTQCIAGVVRCIGGTGPAVETCDGLDNDCSDGVDEDWDFDNDPLHCGGCTPCSIPNATAECNMGTCEIFQCDFGYHDLDPMIPGCEYPCIVTGAEVCDGQDNDCDGDTDTDDSDLTNPPNFCATLGECSGTQPTCTGMGGWDCLYTDPDVETDGNGDLVLEETICDGRDNDCDGGADEPWPLKNTACAEDGTFGTTRLLGACRGTGTLVCNLAQTDLACNITAPGVTPADESCNNVDDDCDGHIDEPYDYGTYTGVRDALLGPITINGAPIVMYEYEASRPDADDTTPGFVETRACSELGRLPWGSVDWTEAEAACNAAGMRLCEVTRDVNGNVVTDEWGRFCESASNRVYPYGNTYDTDTCNGSDYDTDPMTGPNEDDAIPTGELSMCVSLDGAFDMSGNVKEWVDDPRLVFGTTLVHTLRGGSFDNHAAGLTCDFDFTVAEPDFVFPNTGFRCCAEQCPAGQVRCGGACVNLATSSTNCGACGNTCGAGNFCDNGYCCPNGTEICADTCVPQGTCP